MAIPGQEFVIGHVATESSYDPTWESPTWFDLWNLLEQENIDTFALIPLGKISYGTREFGSLQYVTTKDSVMQVLTEYAQEQMQQGLYSGDPNNATDVRAVRAIIWIDPEHSSTLTEKLSQRLLDSGSISHLTGWVIKVIS
jgi:hypothetical protein